MLSEAALDGEGFFFVAVIPVWMSTAPTGSHSLGKVPGQECEPISPDLEYMHILVVQER